MSGETTSSEFVDNAAAEKTTAAPGGVLEAKNGSTDSPTAFNPGAPIDSIRDRLARIVHRELEKMERGEIEVLSEQHNSMLQQLLQSSRQQPRQQRQQAARHGRKQQQSNQQQRKPRPHCTYDRCDKPVGHWESTCIQKARDLSRRNQRSSGTSKRDRSSSPRGNLRHRSRRDRDDDDDEDDRRSQASSTNGDGN